ncbi:unnamed protein product [Cuscuta europaea]|uniref:Uncharacterized protein n=1 Tax=Cuscuta europaea TaxID=41803 RepID=A0A9P0ZAJ7_CUSEU|nr:unnamed protein product [Cuscuta europaea]
MVVKNAITVVWKKEIAFRAFGETHSYTIAQLEAALGFPSRKDWDYIREFPRDVDRKAFYRTVSNDVKDYDPQKSRSTKPHPPEPRVIHTLLTCTITDSNEIGGHVSTIDLKCLYCMIHDKRSYLGILIAGIFNRQMNTRVQSIFVKPYITHLLRSILGYATKFEGM